MRRFCVGVLSCGVMLILAVGCGESSSHSSDSGRFYADRDDDVATAGGQSTSSNNDASTNDAVDASDAKDQPAEASDDGEQTAKADDKAFRQIGGRVDARPTHPPDSAAAGSSPGSSASDGVKRPTRDHMAPQQVATGGDGRARNITFDNLKFEMEDPKSRLFTREMLTDEIEKLSGNRVRIRGFILPGALEEFSNFVLVRDNQECCFGPGAAIYDSMMVDMTDGQIVKFSTRPVTVEGTFEVKEVVGPDNRHWSIYRLTATKVE